MNAKKLYRSRQKRMLMGVCGGLGDYLNLDPTVIRILFLISAIFACTGVIIYLVMWLLVPEEPVLISQEPSAPTAPDAA